MKAAEFTYLLVFIVMQSQCSRTTYWPNSSIDENIAFPLPPNKPKTIVRPIESNNLTAKESPVEVQRIKQMAMSYRQSYQPNKPNDKTSKTISSSADFNSRNSAGANFQIAMSQTPTYSKSLNYYYDSSQGRNQITNANQKHLRNQRASAEILNRPTTLKKPNDQFFANEDFSSYFNDPIAIDPLRQFKQPRLQRGQTTSTEPIRQMSYKKNQNSLKQQFQVTRQNYFELYQQPSPTKTPTYAKSPSSLTYYSSPDSSLDSSMDSLSSDFQKIFDQQSANMISEWKKSPTRRRN